MRIKFRKKSIVRMNFILSLGFGIIMGILFPFYAGFFVSFKDEFLKFFFCAGCIIAGICVGLLAFLITRFTIIRIVKLVANELKEIASGKGDLTKTIQITSQDEIGELIHWFNTFIRRFGALIDATKLNISGSKTTSYDLSVKLNEVSESVKKIVNDILQIKEIQINQYSMVDNTENALSALDDSVLIVISNIMEFFNQMDKLTTIIINQSHAIEEIIFNISLVSGKIGDSTETKNQDKTEHSLYFTGTSFIDKTLNLLERSRHSINKIMVILKNIDDIAVNTNLLAINTSIEAAHAGAAGKGFRIIAGEIHKLADNTNKLTRNIQDVTSRIYEDTERAGSEIKLNQLQYKSTLKDVMSATGDLFDTAESIRQITSDVKSNYGSIGQLLVILKEKMDGLKSNSRYCHEAMQNLKEITGTILTRLKNINDESSGIKSNNSKVLSQFLNLEQSLQDLEKLISDYKVKEH